MDPDDNENEEHATKVATRVDALLALSYDEAFAASEPLRKYIEEQEDAASLQKEFREHWHVEAPPELRQVLEELLDPDLARANSEAVQTFLRDPLAVAPPELGMSSTPFDGNGRMAGSMDVEEARPSGLVNSQVDALLAQPFELALAGCKPLEHYIAGHEDAASVRKEFREHWGTGAPAEMRQVLEEFLDPEIAAANATAVQAFARDPASPALHGETAGPMPMPGQGFNLEGASPLPSTSRQQGGQEMHGDIGEEDFDEEETEDGEDSVDLTGEVERLLRTDLKDAMSQSEELRHYILDREDAEELKAEFEEYWGPNAPKALHQVLEEVLWPALARAEAEKRELAKAEKRELAKVSKTPPRSRL